MSTNYSNIMKSRENSYRFLSRVFEKEITKDLIARLKSMNFSTEAENASMQEGYKNLKDFFNSGLVNFEEELAADYAKTFLGAGESNGKAAFPYESVYTSKEGLVMQEAWVDVKSIYAKNGLVLESETKDIKEDHIAMELQFMAVLAAKTKSEGLDACLAEQKSFIEKHILNWLPQFVADVVKYSRYDFYKGIAKLTLGYVENDLALIEQLLKEDKTIAATSYQLNNDNMNDIIKELKKQYKIYAPKVLKNRGAKGKDLVRYQEIDSIEEVVYDRPSDFSAKEIYYPVMQTMIYFTEDNCTESVLKEDKDILIFLRPCDINAMNRLDTIFLKNGGHADVYYKRLRDKVKIMLLQCNESYDNCFCASMGSNETDNYDMAIHFGKEGLDLQVKSEEFLPYFKGFATTNYQPEFIKENKTKVVLPVINNNAELKLASNLEFWKKFDDKCIGCGGCNTVCPTCSCFDTIDVRYNETSKDGERRRVWSSCMLDTFTMTAGGNRARKTPGSNMRFKALHKVYDFKKRFDSDKHMCVGCGRCINRCPKDICFSDTINELHDALESAKKEMGGN